MRKTSHKQSKKTMERSIFASIRKPIAPPGHAFSHAKPDERARPAMRKAKHKHRPETGGDEE